MMDPFAKYSGSLRPEFDMEDRVEQLYIQYASAPNPTMMLYFYEEFEDYWQCACGSQNDPAQKFCGKCGVRHEWLAAHCSDYVLAARITERKGPQAVRWYTPSRVRIQSPWYQGIPEALAVENVLQTWKGGQPKPMQPAPPPLRPSFVDPTIPATDETIRIHTPMEATRLIPVIREPDRLGKETKPEARRPASTSEPRYERPAEEVDRYRPPAPPERRQEPDRFSPPERKAPVPPGAKDTSTGPSARKYEIYKRPSQRPSSTTPVEKTESTAHRVYHRPPEPPRSPVRTEAPPPRLSTSDGAPAHVTPKRERVASRPSVELPGQVEPVETSAKADSDGYVLPIGDILATVVAAVLLILLLVYVIRPSKDSTDASKRPAETTPPSVESLNTD